MQKNKVAIIILNYEAYHETEKCVKSIFDKGLDVEGIVIVDNASSNESFSYLKRKYKSNKSVNIVKSNKNVGFAKGNNIGIYVAKKNWKVDFILLLNSDTAILEEDYLEKLINGYQTGIGVIQSSVLRLNGRYWQKGYGIYDICGLLLERLRMYCAYYDIYFPHIIKCEAKSKLGPWVSGCDILLTPDFFRIFSGLYPLTFLYGEECILAIMIKRAGLEWKIIEEAHILHAESRSTPSDFREGTRKKMKMVLKEGGHRLFVRIIPLKWICFIINRRM